MVLRLELQFILSPSAGRMLRSLAAASAVAILFLLGPVPSRAQTPTGRVSGTVVDTSGASIPGAEITVRSESTSAEFKTVSNQEGYFIVPALPSGTYTVTASAQGFKQTHVRNVKVDAASASTLTVKLEAGSVVEEVTVSGGGDVINKT